MSLLGDLFAVAAPIVGGIFAGPIGAAIGGGFGQVVNGGGVEGFLKGAAGGYLGNVTGSFLGDLGGYFGSGGASGAESAYFSSFGGDGFGGLPSFYSGYDPNFGSMPDFGGSMAGMSAGTDPSYFGGNIPATFGDNGLPYSMEGAAGGIPMPGYGNPLGSYLSRLANFKSGGLGVPAMRTVAGINSIVESERLKRMMKLPNPQDITGMPGYQAGLEAVQRSMAAQGYQGSGNMMAALAKYGGDFYNQYANQRLQSAQAQAGPMMGTTTGLALLSAGLGGFGG